jgi:hypothetical protein
MVRRPLTDVRALTAVLPTRCPDLARKSWRGIKKVFGKG